MTALWQLVEKLSHDEERGLRKGDQVEVRTRRAVVKRQEPNWNTFSYAPFKGPTRVVAEYLKFDTIRKQWAAEPEKGKKPSMTRPYKPPAAGAALLVRYQGSTVLVPLEDVDEHIPAGRRKLAAGVQSTADLMERRQPDVAPQVAEPPRSRHYAPNGNYRIAPPDKMASSRHRRRRSGREQPFIDPEDFVSRAESFEPFGAMFEIAFPATRLANPQGLRYTAQPIGPGRGVGTSPSASPPPEYPYDVYVDGPTIKKRKYGKKPQKVGAGSMVARPVGRP